MRFVDEYRAPEQVMQLIEHLRERAALLSFLHCRTSVAHYVSPATRVPTLILNLVSISYARKRGVYSRPRLSGLRAADGT